jgi:hypothetical protein
MPGLAQTCECPQGGVSSGPGFSSGPIVEADEPPPPLPDYDQPPIPEPGYYWTPGYWAWNNDDYYWVPGVWVQPPEPELLWTPGYWAFYDGVYRFHRGYWGRRVGFYGGVNYGFGYFGRGYEGGRWEDRRFFYNAAVNNIGSASVANVYSNPVNVTTVNRVSYAGGKGGISATPTPEERRAGSEPHIPPTALQRDQVRAASLRPDQFLSTNQGKPAIAATPRSGDFKGKGVVPAKAAGSAESPPNGAPKQEQKLPAGVKPPAGEPVAPGSSPNGGLKPGEKAPQGTAGQPNAPAQLPNGALKQNLPGEKPIKPEPLNTPKIEPKLPVAPAPSPSPVQQPNGASKLQEKLPGASPNGAIKPPGFEKPALPKGLERQPGVERPQPPAAPGLAPATERPQGIERQNLGAPNGLQRPPVGERPPAPAVQPAQQAKPQIAPNAPIAPRSVARPQPQPSGKPICGLPGLPPCPH